MCMINNKITGGRFKIRDFGSSMCTINSRITEESFHEEKLSIEEG